ncbi:hypothetical protein [Acidovorax sp.]|uniref:hypothetical protein n=1 Tax=Acidovorax sp. TaxID=1872122 RepID=UPI0031D376D4
MSTPLKAYVVHEDDEGNCAVVFATNGATARRDGANELNLSFEEVASCRRQPAFDQYAPGPVPMHATLAAGWWHECGHCQCRFDEDGRMGYEDDECVDAFEPVQSETRATYCSTACMMAEWAERRARQKREHATIEAVFTRWPMAISAVGYERSDTEQYARFTMPGLKYSVQWTPGESTVHVSQCDVDAFKSLGGSTP